MKPVMYFILLGVIAWLLPMAILSQFMQPETALIFSAFAFIVIVTIFFLITGTQRYFKPKIVESKATNITNQAYEERKYTRYKVDHYQGEVTIPDGTKISVLLNDISSGGFQVLCSDMVGQTLTQKIDQLKKIKASQVELTAYIPFKERVEQIKVNCKLAYLAKNEDKIDGTPFVVGLEVTDPLGKNDQIIDKLILEQAIAVA